jgi:hypothetical protein
MTAEDEEFNRIEMESRIKQEYIRAMRKTTREEKISRPAVYEVPTETVLQMGDYIRFLENAVRELNDRLAKLEKAEPVGKFAKFTDGIWREVTDGSAGVPLYTTPQQQELVCVCGAVWEGQELVETPPQRTWVGLTDEEMRDCLNGLPTQTIDVYARRIEAKLKEKNNG